MDNKTTKINLGCGNDIQEGYDNHDYIPHRQEINIFFDLNNCQWNIDADKYVEVRAWDVIEHLDSTINFMDNCWRILKPKGILDIKACGWDNPNLKVDPTHQRGYHINGFDYFDPRTGLGQEYGFYTDKRWHILDKGYDKNKNILIKLTPIK